eukprot:3943679-Pleurochrysis_carterae.AAC.3
MVGACMAAAEAGVVQISIPGVLASVGCAGLAMLSARRGRIPRIISLARTANGGRGGKVLNMGVGPLHGCVSTAMVIQSKGKGDEGGAKTSLITHSSDARVPRLTLRQVRDKFGLAKATDVQNAHRCKEAGAKERGFGQGGGGDQAVKQVTKHRLVTPRKESLVAVHSKKHVV